MAKNDVRRLRGTGGGPSKETIEHLKRTGQLREYSSLQELREARAKRGAKDPPPAYLLPEDHYRKRKRRNVTLSPQALAIAKKIHQGNVSQGIERALFHYHDCPRTDRRKKK